MSSLLQQLLDNKVPGSPLETAPSWSRWNLMRMPLSEPPPYSQGSCIAYLMTVDPAHPIDMHACMHAYVLLVSSVHYLASCGDCMDEGLEWGEKLPESSNRSGARTDPDHCKKPRFTAKTNNKKLSRIAPNSRGMSLSAGRRGGGGSLGPNPAEILPTYVQCLPSAAVCAQLRH